MSEAPQGRVTLVPTPIGNLGDITLRAMETLTAADVICAEDTRRTGILLQHLGIKKPMLSFHEHNEAQRTAEITQRVAEGTHVAVVTDAGMPSISDPGLRLVRACREKDIPIDILPGPSSVLTALVGSGFSTDAFYFGGFLPVKSGGRARELEAAAERSCTTIFFESPHRLLKSLRVLEEIRPARLICVARELSKKFEEYRRGTADVLLAHYTAHPPKGEICLIISGEKG